MGTPEEFATKANLGDFKEEIILKFHIISERLMDHIKLSAEGHSGIVERLNHIDQRLNHIGGENERQHIETRNPLPDKTVFFRT